MKPYFNFIKTCIFITACIFITVCCLTVSLNSAAGIETGEKKDTLRITDAAGRTVEVRLPVKKLVVLTSDALEIVRALDAKNIVAGINTGIAKSPLFWPELKNRAKVGSWRGPNYELIAALDPDVVIGYARHPGPEMEKKLEPMGITVIRLDFYKMHRLKQDIEILGRILQKEKQARQLIDWYREKMEFIKERLKPGCKPPDVYMENYSDYHSVGPGSGADEMCALSGGHNISSDFAIPYPEVTPEWVLTKNPEIIIKTVSFSNCYAMTGTNKLEGARKKILKRPAWDNIRAVREGKVYVMAGDIWTGPMAVVGICYMAKWFYPDFFNDIDPEKIHKEYLEKFQRVSYRGTYVAPGG